MTKPIQTPSEEGTKVIMQKKVGIWGYRLAGMRPVMMTHGFIQLTQLTHKQNGVVKEYKLKG